MEARAIGGSWNGRSSKREDIWLLRTKPQTQKLERVFSVRVIAYVEADRHLGHGETQQELYCRLMLELGLWVIVVTPNPEFTSRWKNELAPDIADHLAIVAPFPATSGQETKLEVWARIARTIAEAENQTQWTVNLVFLTILDDILPSISESVKIRKTMPYPWVALHFFPSFLRRDVPMRAADRLRRLISYSVLLFHGRSRGVAVLDEGLKTSLLGGNVRFPLVWLPERTELGRRTHPEVARIKQTAGGRTVFGLVGELAYRKGILLYLRAAREADPTTTFFVMIGKLDLWFYSPAEVAEIQKLMYELEKSNGLVYPHRIDDAQQFNALVEACDVLVLPYIEFYHSSGILAKAAAFRRPVMVTRGFCLGSRVQRYRLGLEIDPHNKEEWAGAIRTFADKAYRESLAAGPGFAEYTSANSQDALVSGLKALLT